MSCSKYDLQGLHAGIYIARETNGRLGEYQHFPPTCRPANSFHVVLILLAQGSHYPPTSPETRQVEEARAAGECTLVASLRRP
jgi:hypothetical protein